MYGLQATFNSSILYMKEKENMLPEYKHAYKQCAVSLIAMYRIFSM